MNIFYYSVHQILEYDEINLLKSLGHNVFCLGTNSIHGATQSFRPPIVFNDAERLLYSIYESMGGTYFRDKDRDRTLPPGFEKHFSLFIIMNDLKFISDQWDKLRGVPVIWRTIGQGVNVHEPTAAHFRKDGLLIVRYSPTEREAPLYCGEDAMIRFCKRPEDYAGWHGDRENVLTFANSFNRYPREVEAYRAAASRLPCVLGGGSNEGIPGSIGFVDHASQIELYRSSRCYLYISGLGIPYTLNFMEAWMSGLPVVVYAPNAEKGEYFEIDRLIEDGVNGYICRDVDSVIDLCQGLIEDKDRAAEVGRLGRLAAMAHFSTAHIGAAWVQFLSRFERHPPQLPRPS